MKKESYTPLRSSEQDKQQWTESAKKDNKSLSKWIREKLNFNYIAFGNYLLSKERADRVSNDVVKDQVTTADVENFLDKIK